MVEGLDEIVKFLKENKFIKDTNTYSAYEKEGLKFLNPIEEFLQRQFLLILNKFTFYLRTVNFMECHYAYHGLIASGVYRTRLFSRIYRFFRSIVIDFPKYFSEYRNLRDRGKSYNAMEDFIKQWEIRLNSQPFHGGDVPDAVDLKFYSLLRKFYACRKISSMVRYIVRKENCLRFSDWESKMSLLCSRNPHHNSRDFAYIFNPLNKEEVVDDLKARKQDETLYKTDLKGAFVGKKKRTRINI